MEQITHLTMVTTILKEQQRWKSKRPLLPLLDTALTLNDDSSGCAKNVDKPRYGSETSYQLTAPKTEIPGERKENTSADLDKDRENIF